MPIDELRPWIVSEDNVGPVQTPGENSLRDKKQDSFV
jgi:hypothetical protein